MNWYLQKSNGQVYGPIERATLARWAADGRIAPDDRVSQDALSWCPAPDLPGLGMDWLAEISEGEYYGPVHRDALRALFADGTLPADTRIVHKSGERELREPAAAAAPAAPAPPPWKDMAESKDTFEREARKWKQMYEDEHAGGLERERLLNQRIEETRHSELAARTRLEHVGRRLAQLQQSYELLQKAVDEAGAGAPASQLAELSTAYRELSQRYESLVGQLTAKSREIQTLLESRELAERHAEERVRQMQDIVQRAREEADAARRRVAELEEAHLDLVRSYRELNDRFIRLHGGEAVQEQTAAPAARAPERRVRLTRTKT